MYQVWDKDNTNKMNDERSVAYLSPKKWVRAFIEQNKFLDKNSKPLFTPTTIMETDNDDNYAFVIDKVFFDRHDRVVFSVSTKQISLQNNSSKNLIKIPTGILNHVRFDIDSAASDACSAGCWAVLLGTAGIGYRAYIECMAACAKL